VKQLEETMLLSKPLGLAIALSVCAVIALPAASSAAPRQKISYEEAFKRCKKFLDQEKGGLSGGTTSEQHKTRRGAACMKKFGHKL
jgi:hypothetical protein